MSRFCIICREEDEQVDFKTKCEHYFHKKCLEEWSSKSNLCPVCRGDILELDEFFDMAMNDLDSVKDTQLFNIVLWDIILDGSRFDVFEILIAKGISENCVLMEI